MSCCHLLIDALRQKGYRITPQRKHIVDILSHSDRHLSAEEILARVQQHTTNLNLATIYRTLDLLTAQGLASRLDLGDGCVVYATLCHGLHTHLVCRLCGQVIEADHQVTASLEETLVERYHFTADLRHISILGVCAACRFGEKL